MSRLFLAAWPSVEAHEQIVRVQNLLVERIQRQGVRFVRPDKIHLTIQFFGDKADPQALIERLRLVEGSAMELSATGIGAFPGMERPRVVWLGLSGAGLAELAAETRSAVRDVIPETDEFAPHLTLARVNPGSKEVGRILQRMPPEIPIATWTLEELTLVETLAGGDYSIVERFPLARPKP